MRIQCGGGSIEKPFDEKRVLQQANKMLKNKSIGAAGQYMMKERIHNNDECRWQHPELTDIVIWDKVSQYDRHSTTPVK